MKIWVRLVALSALLAIGPSAALSQETQGWDRYLDRPGGPYRGQVVDAETKAPLAGAVVVVHWLRDRLYPVHSVAENYAVRETITDAEGRFFLDAKDVEDEAPRRTRRPGFLIFLPGYGSYPHRHVSPTGLTGGIFERSGAVVELPRLTDREERRKHLFRFDPHSHSDAPFKDLPEFVRKYDAERVAIGLEPLSPGEQP
jgi:hypothetical protein